jgi:probable HAF family extracellular repeat protein
MHMTKRCRLFAICLFSIHVFSQFAYSQSYQILDLGGMLAGSTYSVANGINNSGHVIIAADVGGYRYSKEGGMQILPIPTGYTGVAPFGINDQNEIGVVAYGTQSGQIAFFYSGDNYYLMGDAGGAVLDYIDLNNSGQALWGGPGTTSYLYDFNTKASTQLSVLGYGINDTGQIAGSLNGSGIILNPDGQTINLGSNNIPFQINNLGYAAGSITVSSNPSYITHAFLWTPTNGIIDIHDNTLATTSSAAAINDKTEIVGSFQHVSATPPYRAFYYKNGQMIDLNDRIPANSGWTLTYASAINELGQIVGMGKKDGATRVFLLNPQYGDFAPADCDVDGSDLAVLIANTSLMDLAAFAQHFGRNSCP